MKTLKEKSFFMANVITRMNFLHLQYFFNNKGDVLFFFKYNYIFFFT